MTVSNDNQARFLQINQVQHHGFQSAFKLDQLSGLRLGQSVNAGYAIAYGKHGAYFFQFGIGARLRKLFAQYG